MRNGFRVETRMLQTKADMPPIPVIVIIYGNLLVSMSMDKPLQTEVRAFAEEAVRSGTKPHLVVALQLSGRRNGDINEEDAVLGYLMGEIGGLLKQYFEKYYMLRENRALPCWVYGHHDVYMEKTSPIEWHNFELGWVLRP